MYCLGGWIHRLIHKKKHSIIYCVFYVECDNGEFYPYATLTKTGGCLTPRIPIECLCSNKKPKNLVFGYKISYNKAKKLGWI